MSQRPAGFWVRAFADCLDSLILTIPIMLVLRVADVDYTYEWTASWSWQIIYTAYATIVPLVWSGYIIGKRNVHIKVKRINDGKLTIKNMLMREVVGKFLFTTVTFGIVAIISIFLVIFREDKRAIHDLLAGTYVAQPMTDDVNGTKI